MANSGGPTGCGGDVSHPMSSGWFGGSRAAGTVADLSGQREAARLPGIDDSDSDSNGRGGRGVGEPASENWAAEDSAPEDSEEQAGPAVPDSLQVHTYR